MINGYLWQTKAHCRTKWAHVNCVLRLRIPYIVSWSYCQVLFFSGWCFLLFGVDLGSTIFFVCIIHPWSRKNVRKERQVGALQTYPKNIPNHPESVVSIRVLDHPDLRYVWCSARRSSKFPRNCSTICKNHVVPILKICFLEITSLQIYQKKNNSI